MGVNSGVQWDTPTIKALRYAREAASRATIFRKDILRILIVTMPTTPGEPDLKANEEQWEIKEAVKGAFSTEPLEAPSAKKVLDELAEFDIVHFACHGFSDSSNPSNSSLILSKYGEISSQPEPDHLTVRQISEISLKRARIAYLSACSTAESKMAQLADEVLHLASGFQVAGFGHVIASMWPSYDNVSVDVARGLYSRLSSGGRVWDDEAVATALHQSVMDVRHQRPDDPLSWAQYIHLGAKSMLARGWNISHNPA